MMLVLLNRPAAAGTALRRAGRALVAQGLLCLAIAGAGTVHAAALDAAVADDPFLGMIAEALAVYGIDVSSNLNARDVMRERIEQPRLGRLPDLPLDTLPGTADILNWEAEFVAGQVGGLAILAGGAGAGELLPRWLDAPSAQRLFVTFHRDDLAAIEQIQRVTEAYGNETRLLLEPATRARAGELYSTAAQRLALDTRTARRYDSAIAELDYLGERVRRNSNSLFRDDGNNGDARLARGEPAVFLKESLGDEYNQSTIREIIVPGGVALGETATLGVEPARMVYRNGVLSLHNEDGIPWSLPAIDNKTLKALFDFVSRSEAIGSDAIVDIDGEGRVRIAATLRDTDAGFAIMAADTQPFNYVRNLDVTKSVIIDTAVDWYPRDGALQFETGFEIRFLSADNMRIAQTRAALEYEYDGSTGAVRYRDAWGREARRLQEDLDYAGLGRNVAVVADYAGWVALFRALAEAEVPFLHGRYQFMMIDKAGRETPARY